MLFIADIDDIAYVGVEICRCALVSEFWSHADLDTIYIIHTPSIQSQKPKTTTTTTTSSTTYIIEMTMFDKHTFKLHLTHLHHISYSAYTTFRRFWHVGGHNPAAHTFPCRFARRLDQRGLQRFHIYYLQTFHDSY